MSTNKRCDGCKYYSVNIGGWAKRGCEAACELLSSRSLDAIFDLGEHDDLPDTGPHYLVESGAGTVFGVPPDFACKLWEPEP